MRSPNLLKEYQRKAILHQLYLPDSMLWLGMSLGKTIITLTTIEHRMRAGLIQKTLIFGPVRVIHAVWENEARKWEHTAHLRFSIVHGTPDQRIRALCVDADIYLCNYEGMAWLSQKLQQFYISQNKPLPFQMVVYDEVSRVKNSTSKRVKGGTRIFNKGKPKERKEIYPGWRKMIPHFAFRTGLTGTPASNGYPDLHGQYLCVDGGHRLGEYVTHFREAYLTSDYMGWSHEVTPIGEKAIERKIADITIEMSTRDYLDLPEIIFNDIEVDLPPAVRKNYEEIEKELFTKLDDGTEIELFNKTSVSNKCLQFANGSPYVEPNNPKWVELHDEKYQVLDSIIEEASGNPVAVSYTYRADALRMMDRYKHLNPVNVSGTSPKQTPGIVKNWQQNKIKLLIGHSASMAHGIDGLQDNGDIVVWFGLTWNLEYYKQMNERFMRQGRTKPLTIHRILAKDTMDMAVKYSLEMKDQSEIGLKQAIKKYRAEKQLQGNLDII